MMMGEKMSRIEFRTFSFKLGDVKEVANGLGRIEGYASTFGNVDLGLDIVDRGAFKKTLIEQVKVPILADHQPESHIGWNQEGTEDDKGLFVAGDIEMAVQKGAEKYALAKSAV